MLSVGVPVRVTLLQGRCGEGAETLGPSRRALGSSAGGTCPRGRGGRARPGPPCGRGVSVHYCPLHGTREPDQPLAGVQGETAQLARDGREDRPPMSSVQRAPPTVPTEHLALVTSLLCSMANFQREGLERPISVSSNPGTFQKWWLMDTGAPAVFKGCLIPKGAGIRRQRR